MASTLFSPRGASAGTIPTKTVLTSTLNTAGWLFTVTSANATVGATYTNNANTYTVLATISSAVQLFVSGNSTPTASGTLTKSGGTGDATITFSANVNIGTYTPPSTATALKVTIIGGGGGGGGAASSAAACGAGAGGGGGGACISWINTALVPLLSSYYYCIGGSGVGGTAGTNDGLAGGTSMFNISMVAQGGAGGRGSVTSSTPIIITGSGVQSKGGTSVGGDINISGGAGNYGIILTSTLAAGGLGGATILGGSCQGTMNAGTGLTGGSYGGGGSGGLVINASTQAAGGVGIGGIVIIEEYYN